MIEAHGTRNARNTRRHVTVLWTALLSCFLFSGCAAITNPVANGIPVRNLPPEILQGPRRENMITVPLNLLSQVPPKVYELQAEDVLGIYIDGVLPVSEPNRGSSDPPVYFPSQIDPLGVGLPPSLGFPIPIRTDGTVALPLIDPIRLSGMSINAATEAIRAAYLNKGILKQGRDTMFVTLMQPRQTRVMVIRQEIGGFAEGGRGDITVVNKRGTGHTVDLRAYENDVLHALNQTGGLPGLDVYNAITIFKGGMHGGHAAHALQSLPPGRNPSTLTNLGFRIIQLPTRIDAGAPMPFSPEDVLLENGDIVFLEARATDLFYTAGLLPSGEHELPRDYDLDVVEAVTQIQGPLMSGGRAGNNNLTGTIIDPGFGQTSPNLLTVIRRTPNGQQIPIQVDLNLALRDARERILVQPGDVLILQETPNKAFGRWISQKFNFSIMSEFLRSGSALGTASGTGP